jgi:hypothetical protein
MPDRQQRVALAWNISARIGALVDAGDELRVIDALLIRLELGLDRYGPLNLKGRSRDFQRESDEELVDWLVYQACKRVSDRDTQIAAIESGLDELATNAPADVQTPAIDEDDRG